MKHSLLLSLFALCALLFAVPSFAEQTNGCQPVFGGGSSCITNKRFSLDKKVQNRAGAFVDTLNVNDETFGPNQEVIFYVLITNTGNALKNLTITDVLPTELRFVSADNGGTFDQNTHSVTVKLASLDKNEAKTITIKARTPEAASLPDTPICLVNQAYGAVGRDKADDNSRLCVAKQATLGPIQPPVTNQGQATTKGGPPVVPTQPAPSTTKGGLPLVSPTMVPNMTKGGQPIYPAPTSQVAPNTGPEALALIALLPSGLGGLLLRRKTK